MKENEMIPTRRKGDRMDEKISAYETEHKLTVHEFQMMGDKDFANPVRHRELYLALVDREAIRAELTELRVRNENLRTAAEKQMAGSVKLRDMLLERDATIAKLPKDAEGNSIAPGMKVWFAQPTGPIVGYIAVSVTESGIIDEFGCEYRTEYGYINPNMAAKAAAEAAKEKKD